MNKDVVIIGAGASGLMCALTAGMRNRSVLVLDHAQRIAGKVRISGGGRCNFTNLCTDSSRYVSQNPHFCKSALSRFTPRDFIGLLERHGIKYYEKEDGQIFCSGSSGEIVRMFREACEHAGAEIRQNSRIISIEKKDSVFTVTTDSDSVTAASLVIAAGGLSYHSLGATDIGYRIARQFGLKVTPLKPGLVPLVFAKSDLGKFKELSGVSFRATVSCGPVSFDGMVLFTHRGLSGPAILQISLYWENGRKISINLLPDLDIDELLSGHHHSKMKIENLLSRSMPERLAKAWCAACIEPKPMNQYTERELKVIADRLGRWEIFPEGTEGYAKAEVTVGGVDTTELSSKTMEAKKVPGLYFIGEVVDVTGQLGGYNLQWAWSSGYAAGQFL